MRLTEDRISHLSHLILNHLLNEDMIFVTEHDEGKVRARIKRVFIEELRQEEALDDKIRHKISSYKRHIPEGSSEWQILYQRFYKEEMDKRGAR